MSKQSNVIHHFSIRKRIHQKHEPFPHPNKIKRFIDKMIYPIGILGPIMSIPQLWAVFVEKKVIGLSIITWSIWAFFDIFWMIYGFAHKERPIIITYTMWLVVNLSVVVGVLLYR